MHLVPDIGIDWDKYLAPPADAAKIRPASEWCQAVIDELYSEEVRRGAYLPWGKTHGYFRMRPGEVTVWAGINGHGKSAILSHIMLGVMAQSERVCIASMEMKPKKTMERMSRQAGMKAEPSPAFIRQFHTWTDGKLWLYDQQGTVEAKRILAVSRYCADDMHIQHMVIDSLMKCGIGVDDYNGQKAFLNSLCSLAQDTGMHIHLVAHSRKGNSEHDRLDKFDVKGAGDIVDQTDNLFLVARNKRKEEQIAAVPQGDIPDPDLVKQPDAILQCCKQRHGDWEGRIPLWFDRASMQYVTDSRTMPFDITRLG